MLKVGLAIAVAVFPTVAVRAETPNDVAQRYRLAGELLVAKGDRIILHRGYGTIAPTGGARHRSGESWRLASISKQVTAALLIRDIVIADLDRPDMLGGLTRRQLLTHHTGLANPDESPSGSDDVPFFYKTAGPDIAYCTSKPAKPGAPFRYNNCDYLLLKPASARWSWPAGMAIARTDQIGVPGFIKGRSEPHFKLAAWGDAGGLIGTLKAVYDFDRSLMTGKLLPPNKLAELWRPESKDSYQALGQWVFPGQLKGCAAPKRIVQRDGEIFGVQARNYILPDDGIVVIVFANRSSDDFPLGEIWQRSGFTYDLVSAAACG